MKYDKQQLARSSFRQKLAWTGNQGRWRLRHKTNFAIDSSEAAWDSLESMIPLYSRQQRTKLKRLMQRVLDRGWEEIDAPVIGIATEGKKKSKSRESFLLILKNRDTGLYVTQQAVWNEYNRWRHIEAWVAEGKEWKGPIPRFPRLEFLSDRVQDDNICHLMSALRGDPSELEAPIASTLSVEDYKKIVREQMEILNLWCRLHDTTLKRELRKWISKRRPLNLKENLENSSLIEKKYLKTKQILLLFEELSNKCLSDTTESEQADWKEGNRNSIGEQAQKEHNENLAKRADQAQERELTTCSKSKKVERPCSEEADSRLPDLKISKKKSNPNRREQKARRKQKKDLDQVEEEKAIVQKELSWGSAVRKVGNEVVSCNGEETNAGRGRGSRRQKEFLKRARQSKILAKIKEIYEKIFPADQESVGRERRQIGHPKKNA